MVYPCGKERANSEFYEHMIQRTDASLQCGALKFYTAFFSIKPCHWKKLDKLIAYQLKR